jgi:hypothetical protein
MFYMLSFLGCSNGRELNLLSEFCSIGAEVEGNPSVVYKRRIVRCKDNSLPNIPLAAAAAN